MKRFKYTTLLLILCFALPVLAQQQGDNTTPEFEASYKAAVEYYWSSNKTPEEAIDLFTALIDENPDFPEAYAYRASVYRVEQDFELAQIDLNMALELEPDNALVNSVQARLFFDMGDEDTAQDLAAEFADRDDLVADTYYNFARVMTDNYAIIDGTTRAIEITPRADFYYNRGIYQNIVGQPDVALADYMLAIGYDPNFTAAYINAGNIYRRSGFYAEAFDLYNQAINRGLEDVQLYNNRGVAYSQTGQLNQARDDYNRAIALDPTFSDAYLNRGADYLSLGNMKSALEDFNIALELNPQNSTAYYNRGIAYRRMDDSERAIEDYTSAVTYNPDYHQAYLNRAKLYRELGDFEAALADYDSAIVAWPRFYIAHHQKGITYSMMERYEDAIVSYEIGLLYAPNYKFLHHSMGIDYANLGEYEKSIESYARAAEIDPTYASAYYGQYLGYLRLDNQEEAEKYRQLAEQYGYFD